MSISLSHLTKRYGDDAVVDDVNVEIPESSLTAVLGPSGSGKSTLLKLIAGLERPDEGRVVIEGDDVTDVDPRHRDIGFCFQHYAPFRHMTVARNIGFGLRVRKQPKDVIDAKVAELIELVRLDGKAKSYPAQLSGGERQRMALARALAIEPRVLLLDEPFGALDALVRTELRQWVKELHRQIKVTTILVTHDQDEAMEVADQLLIMHKGRIEQAGEPTELYERPATEFVHGFLGPTTMFKGVSVRPHDLELVGPSEGAIEGTVQSVMELGFEVQVTVALSDGTTPWVQMSRNEFRNLHVGVGSAVSVRERL
ncbi:MAG: sulfate ABC transporter ATP-binding protein [Acidimicrobiales bacterium]